MPAGMAEDAYKARRATYFNWHWYAPGANLWGAFGIQSSRLRASSKERAKEDCRDSGNKSGRPPHPVIADSSASCSRAWAPLADAVAGKGLLRHQFPHFLRFSLCPALV